MEGYITKNSYGLISFHHAKPRKGSKVWLSSATSFGLWKEDLPSDINPEWEDKEPIEVKLSFSRLNNG